MEEQLDKMSDTIDRVNNTLENISTKLDKMLDKLDTIAGGDSPRMLTEAFLFNSSNLVS